MSAEKNTVQAAVCPSCGAGLARSTRSEYDREEEENVQVPIARCMSCGREYDRKTKEYYEFFSGIFTDDIDASVFTLGIKGAINGVEYEIIGRIRYQEEEEHEKSTWDEWFAVSSDGKYVYYVEEDREVFAYEEYVPQSIDLESDPKAVIFEGKRVPRSSAYVSRIVFAAGELPWKPEIGEPMTCYDFKKERNRFTIEQSEEEVSVTKGARISYKTVIETFRVEEYREKYEKTMAKRKEFKRMARVFLAAAVIACLVSIVTCATGTPVKDVMKNRKVITDNRPVIEENMKSNFSQVLFGPFEIPEKDRLYEVGVSVNTAVHPLSLEWQSFRLMLIKEERLRNLTGGRQDREVLKDVFDDIDLNAEPAESYVVAGDFWDEEGRDDEGYWHESDKSASGDFVLDEEGKYFAYLELYNDRIRKPEAVNIGIDMVSGYRYYVIASVLFVILMMVYRARARSFNELPFDIGSE